MFKPEGFQFYCMYRKGAYFQTVFREMAYQTRGLRNDFHVWDDSINLHPERWHIANHLQFGWLMVNFPRTLNK